MNRNLPTSAEVTVAMDQVLAEAASNGHRATLTTVERALGIPHATFYRNYPDLVGAFRRQAHEQRAGTSPASGSCSGENPRATIERLRKENQDLRQTVKIYAESIRQLTLNRLELETKLNAAAGITTLYSRDR